MSAPRPWTRLPGRGARSHGCVLLAVGVHTLWVGEEQLLSVDWWGYTETYRRFAYREILSITAHRTKRWLVTNLVGLAILLGLVGGSFLGGEVLAVTLRVLAGLVVLPFLVNLLLGPTCKVTLRTAVHSEELPAWGRTRAFRRGIERLRPRILAAQAPPAAAA